MAFLVEPPIDVPRVGVIRPGRNTEIRVMVGNKLAKLPLAVGPVSKNGRILEVDLADQFLGNSNVRVLPVVNMIAMGLPKASTAA